MEVTVGSERAVRLLSATSIAYEEAASGLRKQREGCYGKRRGGTEERAAVA